jgi:hypothetical protein
MKPQISAIARLQSLPSVFRGSDLTVRFQWTSKTASQYLYLWKRRGLVQGLGGHSDVYANLLTNPKPDWGKAMMLAMPSAVVIGVEALRQAGWTTQVPHRPTVAVDARHSIYSTEFFEVEPHGAQWFESVRSGVQGERRLGLPTLRPAWALAEMLRTQGWGRCGLWPDDIDWDQVKKADEVDWQSARKALTLEGPDTLHSAGCLTGS